MNQSKFSLADVLTVLAALVFGFVCFLGANFLNINNDKVWGMPHITGCIVIALFCSGLLFITSFGAKLLKRTSRNFKTSFILEMIFLTLFVLFAVFFATKYSPFTHFFTVTAKKSEINSKLQKSITQAENMFAAYESYARDRKNLYRSILGSVVASKDTNYNEYLAHGFRNSGVSDERQIETKMFGLHNDLFPTNYSDTTNNNGIKEVATIWLKNAKSITNIWRPIGIVGVVNNIEKNSTYWRNNLFELSNLNQQDGDITGFFYPLSFDDVKTNFTKIEPLTPLSIFLALLLYVLMLLSWIVTTRSTRFPGLKFLFGISNSRDNEL